MILVTGASGFIGRHVVSKLIDEHKAVVVLVRNAECYRKIGNEIVVEGVLEDYAAWINLLEAYEIESCIHLAWEGIPDYSYEMSKKNLLNGLCMLEVCKQIGVKHLIISGSCWEYESPRGSVSVNDEISLGNDFKAAKNSLRSMAHAFCMANDIKLHWMRLFYVYGPGQRAGSLIPHIIAYFKEGKQPELNDAFNKNDFVYVRDVADAMNHVLENPECPEVLNVGSGYSTQVLEIVKIAAKCMDIGVDETKYSPSGNEADFYADATEMDDLYRWRASTSLEDGIRSMI